MSFFNKKEEVIDIQLTKHGRELLARGKFKPYYYSFFDKDVIYDAETYDLVEPQNNIQDRILEAVNLKTQPNYEQSQEDYRYKSLFRLNNLLGAPIGTSNPDSNYFPAWNIDFLASGIYSVNTASDKDYNKFGENSIPQINLKPTFFEVSIEKNYKINTIFPRNEKLELVPKLNGDNTYIKSRTEDVIISIEEKNTIDIMDNFEIEFFHVNDNNVDNPLTKLNIYKQRKSIISRKIENDLLMDELEDGLDDFSEDENNAIQNIIGSDSKNIGFYFNVQADSEISIEEINLLSQLAGKRLFIYDPITGRGGGFGNLGSTGAPDTGNTVSDLTAGSVDGPDTGGNGAGSGGTSGGGIGGPTSGVGNNGGDNLSGDAPRNIAGEGDNC